MVSEQSKTQRRLSLAKKVFVQALGRCARSASALILTYHRVSPPTGFDPFHLRVSPERFAAQLAYLKTHYRVAPLAELVHQIGGKRLATPGQVAITFDDGYADNFHSALPALQHAGLPATFFVTTAYVDSPRGFWWDELEAMVEEAETLGFALADLLPDSAPAAGPAGRHALYHQLHRTLRPLPDEQRQARLDQLRHLGVGGKPSADNRPLRWTEVGALIAAGHEIGSHTVTHPVLSALSPAETEKELVNSKQAIEVHTGRPVTALAYPYGRPETIGAIAGRVARNSSYRCGLTTVYGTINPGSDPFRLKRLHVRGWDQDTFAYELARCFAERVSPMGRRRA